MTLKNVKLKLFMSVSRQAWELGEDLMMKNRPIYLVFAMVLLGVSQSFAGVKSFVTTESTKNTLSQDQTHMTPRERIQQSEKKVVENPDLRGRWDPKSHEPASEGSAIADNLADKVLSTFREDEALSKIPANLKVSSSRGVVTLEGVVNNVDEKSLIENKVSKMEGVKKVENHLKIKTSDQDLLN